MSQHISSRTIHVSQSLNAMSINANKIVAVQCYQEPSEKFCWLLRICVSRLTFADQKNEWLLVAIIHKSSSS